MLEIDDNRKKILIGVAVVVILVIVIQSLSGPAKKKPHAHRGGKPAATAPASVPNKNAAKKRPSSSKPVIEANTLEEAKKLAKDKLKRAEMLTRDRYSKMQAQNPRLPVTLQEFIDEQRKAVLKYESMTIDEWVALENARQLRKEKGTDMVPGAAETDAKDAKVEEKSKAGDNKAADKDKAEKPKADKKVDKSEKPVVKTETKATEVLNEDKKP